MDIYEQLPVLLKVESNGDEIKLRLDENGLGDFGSSDKSIQEIILSGCKIRKGLIDELQQVTSAVFEYEVSEKDGKRVFQFWCDYGRIENEIECKSFKEIFSEYTKVDLIQKGKALYDLYIDLYERFSTNFSLNNQLREKLKFEIKNEIERSQRKAEFFQEKAKGKSEAFQTEIKTLQKLQRILNSNFKD